MDNSKIEAIVEQLQRSSFRRRFAITGKELEYLREKGTAVVLEHGRKIVLERLAAAYPANDGKQTPYRNHPIFVAQHATATCCRSCLSKWHGIPKGTPLSEEHIEYILEVFRLWLERFIRDTPR